jgi:hypothetical protein
MSFCFESHMPGASVEVYVVCMLLQPSFSYLRYVAGTLLSAYRILSGC